MHGSKRGQDWLDYIAARTAANGAPSTPTTAPFEVMSTTVFIRTLSPERIAALFQWSKAHPGCDVQFAHRIVSASVVDEDGNALLAAADVDDLDPRAVKLILDEVRRRNGI